MWNDKKPEAKIPNFKRKRWEKEEIKTLLQMWEGSTIEELTKALNRSPSGIGNIVYTLRKRFGVELSAKGHYGRIKVDDLIRQTLDEMNIKYLDRGKK